METRENGREGMLARDDDLSVAANDLLRGRT